MFFGKRKTRALSNLVAEAILVAIVMGWIAMSGHVLFSTQNSLREEENLAIELLFCTESGSAVFRSLNSGVLKDVGENTTLYVFSPTINDWVNITLPKIIHKNSFVLIETTGVNFTWIASGSLFYFLDYNDCRLSVAVT